VLERQRPGSNPTAPLGVATYGATGSICALRQPRPTRNPPLETLCGTLFQGARGHIESGTAETPSYPHAPEMASILHSAPRASTRPESPRPTFRGGADLAAPGNQAFGTPGRLRKIIMHNQTRYFHGNRHCSRASLWIIPESSVSGVEPVCVALKFGPASSSGICIGVFIRRPTVRQGIGKRIF